ncbi:hypothetical protein [Streptomyces sp. BPTC-684]|uniref:hypothetical protein n=1 Tax=Streptomyces sp. BPTC-684 TaxID=3043734 RepID=UPI0024B16990|nr:hypothetical protein [Streptomyces sp. BPTC-684]WHM40723.1 hypothetical protein QIY60_30180 [Streptomyces sp. BPTC-684]
MPIDFAASLRRHYSTFLAVLVTGVVLIIARGGTSQSTVIALDCALGVARLVSGYVLAPAPPSASRH